MMASGSAAGSTPRDTPRVMWLDREGRVNACSAAAEALFDRSPIGAAAADLLPEVAASIAEAVASGGGGSLTAGVSGEPVDIHLTAMVTDGEHHGFAMILVGQSDKAADLAAAEQARRAAEEAAEAKARFLANMSHEIRTPMNGVMGMLEMLRHTELSERQQHFLSIAHGSAESLLTVINDVLDFSKIEAGRVSIEHIPFQVAELVEDVTLLFGNAAAAKGVDLDCYVSPDTPQTVVGDPTRIRQILTNIVGNAVKFTERGEVVVVADTVVAADRDDPGRALLRLQITDTGVGMDEGTTASVFRPFVQASAATARRFGGTGLGLAICRQLTDLMGGTISATSRRGEGSTFEVRIPVGVADATPIRNPGVGEQTPILIAATAGRQHSPAVRYFTEWVGSDLAADAQGVEDMVRAALTRGSAYRLVILDRRGAGGSFDGLPQRIKSIPGTEGMQVVMLSGSGARAGSREPGVDFMVPRPIRLERVLQIARQMAGDAIPAPRQSMDLPDAMSGSILLVEDNVVNQRVAATMLEALGLRVHIADNGSEALSELAGGRFDAVLMDCLMPQMDGFEATRRLRKMPGPAARLPVIAMTARAMSEDRKECIAAGMDDYIAKPFTLDQLAAILRKWLPAHSNGAAAQGVAATRAEGAAGSAASEQSHIDDAALDKLASRLPADRMARLVGTFTEETPKLLDRMTSAAEAGEADELRLAAHSLKGSSAFLGAVRLSALARSIEQDSRDPASCLPRVREAVVRFYEVKRELQIRHPTPQGAG